MRNAGPDGFRKGVKSLLLLQPLRVCSELQTQVCKHLILEADWKLVSPSKTWSCLNGIPLQLPLIKSRKKKRNKESKNHIRTRINCNCRQHHTVRLINWFSLCLVRSLVHNISHACRSILPLILLFSSSRGYISSHYRKFEYLSIVMVQDWALWSTPKKPIGLCNMSRSQLSQPI